MSPHMSNKNPKPGDPPERRYGIQNDASSDASSPYNTPTGRKEKHTNKSRILSADLLSTDARNRQGITPYKATALPLACPTPNPYQLCKINPTPTAGSRMQRINPQDAQAHMVDKADKLWDAAHLSAQANTATNNLFSPDPREQEHTYLPLPSPHKLTLTPQQHPIWLTPPLTPTDKADICKLNELLAKAQLVTQ